MQQQCNFQEEIHWQSCSFWLGLARMQIAFSLFGRVWPPEERFVIYCWRLRVGRIYMRPTKRAKKQQAAIAGRKTSNWSGSVVKFYIWGQGWRNAFQVFLFLVWRAMSLWVMNSCSSCRGSKSDMLAALAILAILAPRQSYFWSQNKKLQSSAAWRTSRIFEKASIPTGVDHYI